MTRCFARIRASGARAYRVDMDPVAAVAVLAAVVLVGTAIGLVLRRREGQVRHRAHEKDIATPDALGLDHADFGSGATLVQFSTEYCTRCPQARRVLGGIAQRRDGVSHVDVDLTHRPDLAKRFHVLQTPTTLIVDATGAVRARIGGAPRPDEVAAELDRLLETTHV